MDLPFEVLVYLFKYLPHGDRVAAGQTCRLWYEASCDSSFQSKQHICFTKNPRGEKYIADIFSSENCKKFTNYTFREIDLENKFKGFWQQNGESIKCLNFDDCEMHEYMFITILNSCPNLESLSVSNCRELFMSARFLDDELKSSCKNNLRKLKMLNLSKNRYLSDALFSRLVTSTESLENLDLSDCPITFHSALHKRFYPEREDKENMNPSESILTFPFIYEFLKKHQKSMNKLSFNHTLLDGSALQMISELPNLRLKSLQAYGSDQLNSAGILSLTTLQNNLVELNLGMCSRITDEILIVMSKNIVNLKSLNISKCNMVTDNGITALKDLKNLEHLDISQCSLIYSEGLKNGICNETKYNMQSLNISSLTLDEYIIVLIAEKLPNLRVLNMNHCFMAVTDTSIQEVFKNLLQLTTLCIKYCNAVSDAGITGMGICKQINKAESSRGHGFGIKNNEQQRISLRSRAEQEIVRDAERKKEVRELCEKHDTNVIDGYSLSRLKSLQHLDVSGCNHITDVSLIYCFKNKELKNLYLSDCQQITHEGLSHLVLNCHSIETLDLSNCYNTRDEGVKEIVQNLPRLKNFNLSGCNLLTDKSLNAIQSECKSLKILDLRNCRNLSIDHANSLYGLSTIHKILVSKSDTFFEPTKKIPKAPQQPKMGIFRRIF